MNTPEIQTELTDTDRLNALFTLFGGHYVFQVGFNFPGIFKDGRRGLDKFIAEHPSLLPTNQKTT